MPNQRTVHGFREQEKTPRANDGPKMFSQAWLAHSSLYHPAAQCQLDQVSSEKARFSNGGWRVFAAFAAVKKDVLSLANCQSGEGDKDSN